MKALFVSNFYPPHHVGGYELGCRDVVEALRGRGHDVRVLTSAYGVAAETQDGVVERALTVDPEWAEGGRATSFRRVLAKEARNRRVLRRALRRHAPDVAYFWNLGYLSASALTAESTGEPPTLALVSDHWLAGLLQFDTFSRWCREAPRARVGRVAKRLVISLLDRAGRVPSFQRLSLSEVHFTSRFLEERALRAGVPIRRSRVIRWGVDPGKFRAPQAWGPCRGRLLYVGQIAPHKGVHTALEALARLPVRPGQDAPVLSIAGGSVLPAYEAEIRDMVPRLGLDGRVRFLGNVPRDGLPAVYADHDILLFPSTWEEPFSITLLEAMACGLAVVTTLTGGTPELVVDGSNALAFPASDAAACAGRVTELLANDRLFDAVRRAGRATVESGYRLEAMVDRIEAALGDAIS